MIGVLIVIVLAVAAGFAAWWFMTRNDPKVQGKTGGGGILYELATGQSRLDVIDYGISGVDRPAKAD